MKERFNSIMNGVNLGMLGPILGAYLYYLGKFADSLSFDGFIDFASGLDVAPKMLALSSIMNLLIFFIFIWLKMDKTAKGVIYATFFYGAVIIVLLTVGFFAE